MSGAELSRGRGGVGREGVIATVPNHHGVNQTNRQS